jgi:hypothetical protein
VSVTGDDVVFFYYYILPPSVSNYLSFFFVFVP